MSELSPALTIGLISIGTPWFDLPAARKHLAATWAMLGQAGSVVGPDDIIVWEHDLPEATRSLVDARPDVLVLQIGTFPIGDAPATLAQSLGVPVIVHSIPEPDVSTSIGLNSLCGANLTGFTLTELDQPYTWIHGGVDAAAVADTFSAHIAAVRALKALRRNRLHLVGFRAPGFYPCSFDELLLRRTFGIGIDHIGLHEMASRLDQGAHKPYPGPEALPAIGGGALAPEAKKQMEAYYGALSSLIEDFGSTIVAIKDWPEFYDASAKGGFWPSLGWVQDDGVVLAVEGDVNGAITMSLEHAMTGDVPMLVDISAWDGDASTLLLWHYGGAPSLARSQAEILYGEEGHEVEFTLKAGTATLARVGMNKGQLRLLTIAVEIDDQKLTTRRAAGLARTTTTNAGDIVRQMVLDGWEHHVCLIYGDVRESFRAVSRFTGIPLVEL